VASTFGVENLVQSSLSYFRVSNTVTETQEMLYEYTEHVTHTS